MISTLSEIAERLELNSDTLERWIRQGRIPVKRKGGGLVFNEAELARWAESQRLCFRQPGRTTCEAPELRDQSLTAAVRAGGCHAIPHAESKEDILKAVVAKVPGMDERHAEELLGLLLEREGMTTTGIGKGLAIPHPRNPMKGFPDRPMIVTCFPESPLDFEAIDGRPVFVLFLLLSPSIEDHLGLLSRLSFCLRDTAFVEFLKRRPDPETFAGTVETLELTLDKKGF